MSKQDKQPSTVVNIGIACENPSGNRGVIPDATKALLKKMGYRPFGRNIGKRLQDPTYRMFADSSAAPRSSTSEAVVNVYLGTTDQVLSRVETGALTAAIVKPESVADRNVTSTEVALPGVFRDSTVRASIVLGEDIKPEILRAGSYAGAKTTEQFLLARIAKAARRFEIDAAELAAGKNFRSTGEEAIAAWRFS